MNTVSTTELVDFIVATFVPSDVVYKRIESYLFHTEQKDKTACADYLRLRREREEALATDGIELPEEVKRALMVRGMKDDVRAQLKRRTDWWTVPLEELRRRAILESKAFEETQKSRPGKQLYAAVGGPRLSDDRPGPPLPLDG